MYLGRFMIYIKNPKYTDRHNGFPCVFCFFPRMFMFTAPHWCSFFGGGEASDCEALTFRWFFFPIEVGGIAFEYNLMMIQQ